VVPPREYYEVGNLPVPTSIRPKLPSPYVGLLLTCCQTYIETRGFRSSISLDVTKCPSVLWDIEDRLGKQVDELIYVNELKILGGPGLGPGPVLVAQEHIHDLLTSISEVMASFKQWYASVQFDRFAKAGVSQEESSGSEYAVIKVSSVFKVGGPCMKVKRFHRRTLSEVDAEWRDILRETSELEARSVDRDLSSTLRPYMVP
jgi:hypothetical protein